MQTVTQQQQADSAALHGQADANTNNDNYVGQYFGSGGATLAGSPESTAVDEFTGVSRFNFPLPLTACRGATPSLSLSYQAGLGHSPFGMGIDLGVPTISRRTSGIGIPTYTDKDVFSFNGQYLVPEMDDKQQLLIAVESINGIDYQVQSFLLRDQTKPIYIQFLVNKTNSADCFWRVRGSDNSVMIYGRTASARIANPDDTSQVFSWLLEEVVDSKHNHQRWYYKAEDTQGVNNAQGSVEANHKHSANRYLTRIAYGNNDHIQAQPYLLMPMEPSVNWLFEVVLDHGEHNLALTNTDPYLHDKGQWSVRQDSYSNYRMGFEVRTHRLCRNILLFHRFDELSSSKAVLVKRWRLEYQESQSVSQLSAITSIGLTYQPSVVGQPYRAEILPPVELGYQPFTPIGGKFSELKAQDGGRLSGLNYGQYQLIDLFQQGIASAVYRDNNTLYYRQVASVSKDDKEQYQLRYGELKQIDALPTSGAKGLQLTNITAEGKLELVEGKPGRAGFYQATGEGDWRSFIPFDAFPSEYGQKGSQFADITGDGTGDIVLIGPQSVRFYANKGRQGYAAPVENRQLPVDFPTSTEGQGNVVIGFSDLLGSGQPHLFRMAHNKVEVWPNLGYGKFGEKIEMAHPPVLDDASFTPEAVFLADTDGSGTSDIVYVDGNKAKVYLNLSGNSFAAPFEITLPEAFDSINQVSFADVFGCGSAAMVLTVTSPEVRHYAYDFSQGKKPYLLTGVNNNQGKNTKITYGSSVHEYLADKAANKPWLSALPLAVQVVKSIEVSDEVNQLTLGSSYCYHHGFYDFIEKQYRGFARVDVTELERNGDKVFAPSAPSYRSSWYHTGDKWFDSHLAKLQQEFYQGDSEAVPLASTLFTAPSLSDDKDVKAFTINANRAMSGALLRSELYGMSGDKKRTDPYSVTEQRYQVSYRQSDKNLGISKGSVQRHQLESISYQYDEVSQDPKVKHQITRHYDPQGYATDIVDITYPRRTFSNRLYHHTSQDLLWAMRQQFEYIHQQQNALLLTGYNKQLISTELQNLTLPPSKLRFSYETLTDSAVNASTANVLAKVKHFYAKPNTLQVHGFGLISSPALLSHTETTAFDKTKLSKLLVTDDKVFANVSELETLLTTEGKYQTTDGDHYWWQSSVKTHYNDNTHFYQPSSHTDAMGNKTTLSYDKYKLQVVSIVNPYADEAKAQWNYRCMQPVKLTDINENGFYYQYDGFSRQVRYSYRGKENGQIAGFAALPAEPNDVSVNQLLTDGVNQVADSASVKAYADYAWMPRLTPQELSKDGELAGIAVNIMRALLAANWLTSDLHVRAKVYQMIKADRFILPAALSNLSQSQHNKLKTLISNLKRQPLHQVSVDAELYSVGRTDLSTVRTAINYVDGFGRILQQKAKVENGEAFVIDDHGDVVIDNQQPKLANSNNRWLTSGRVILNNKGLPVRQYEPYYLNTSEFVDHDALNHFGVSSTQYHDTLGRIVKVVSAKGFETRSHYQPWYLQEFDQNDTLLSSQYYLANLDGSTDASSEYYDQNVVADLSQQSAPHSDVEKFQAVESRKATLSASSMTDTPTTMLLNGLGHLVAKRRLDHVSIETNTFAAIFTDSSKQNKLLQWLKSEGVVSSQNTLSSSFNGKLSALPSELADKQSAVLAKLIQLDTERLYQSTMTYNAQGQKLTEQDARLKLSGRNNTTNTFNLSQLVKTDSADKGKVWHLTNAAGKVIWQRDARHNLLLFSYDKLQRLQYLKEMKSGRLQLREKYVYGDVLTVADAPQDRNLRGKLLKSFSQAGLQVAPLGYTLKGELLKKDTYPVKSYSGSVDWPSQGDGSPLWDINQLHNLLISYNALGQQLEKQSTVRASGQSYTTRYRYYPSSRLAEVKHQASGQSEQTILSDVIYAANSLVIKERHSGLESDYQYDPKSLKLLRLVSKKRSDNTVVRDQRLAYDPVGNVKLVLDVASLSKFNHLNKAEAGSRYQYDALYRLTQASGRKQLGALDSKILPAAIRLSSSKADVTKYTQSFEYDKGHNLNKASMQADSNHNASFLIADDSNRSALKPVTSDQLGNMFDQQGNQIKWSAADSQQKLFWDFKNQLQKVVLVHRSGGKDDAEYYQYDQYGQRLRKVTERYASDLNTVNVEQVQYFGTLEIRTKGTRQADSSTVTSTEVLHVDAISAGSQGQSRFYNWLSGKPSDQQNQQYRTGFRNSVGQAQLDVSATGDVIAYIEYLPFGGTALHSTAKDSDVKLKYYRHSGKERDATGLYYYGLRYYAPWQMRWVSADPAGNIDGLNLYAYVQNNPSTYSDADGLSSRSSTRRESQSSVSSEASASTTASANLSSELDDDLLNFAEALTITGPDQTASQSPDAQKSDEQEQAEYLITQIVSIGLNATEANKMRSAKAIRSAYRALEHLANSEDLTADQLGDAFKSVAKTIVAAVDKTEVERDITQREPSKEDRNVLGRNFDQLTSFSVNEPLQQAVEVEQVAQVEQIVETIAIESLQAVELESAVVNNDVTLSSAQRVVDFTPPPVRSIQSILSTPVSRGTLPAGLVNFQSRFTSPRQQQNSSRQLAGIVPVGNTRKLIQLFEQGI